MLYFSILALVLSAYAFFQVRAYVEKRRLMHSDWSTLLDQIHPVNIGAITEIANCYLHPTKTQLRIEPNEMWERIGRLKGLEVLSDNAEAILNLATYATRWNRVEGRVVREMIRRDGVRLRRSVWQIELALVYNFNVKSAAFALQEMLATYGVMRARLLGLYEVAHVGLYPRLAEVL